MKRLIALVSLAALVSACGSSPSAPTPTPPPAVATRIITVAGNLAFGNVNLGSSADRTFTISNSGNATLTFTSLSCSGGSGPSGYTASPTSGTVPAGSTTTVNLHFAPTTAGFLSCVLSVVGDQTGGGAAINVSGTGVNPNPIFTQTGSGATVFTMPTYVARVRITGDYAGSCENFIIHIAGRGVVNEILGSCSVASGRHFEGTYATSGGLVEVLNSTSIQWTFTEIR